MSIVKHFIKLWMRWFPDQLARNLAKPNTGIGGYFVEQILEERNEEFEKIIARLCNIQPDHIVLEIGFGPGFGIKEACRYVKDGQGMIYGIDASERMVRTASKRLQAELLNDKVVLHNGSVTQLPYTNAAFNVVFHCHSFYYWEDLDTAVQEIHRVLKKDGVLLTAVKPDSLKYACNIGYLKYGNPDHTRYIAALIRQGFVEVECVDEDHPAGIAFKVISGRV